MREFYINGDQAINYYSTRIECEGDIHVIEYSAYQEAQAEIKKLKILLESCIPDIERNIPEPSHEGSCNPETICDMSCSDAFHGAIFLNEIKQALAQDEEGEK